MTKRALTKGNLNTSTTMHAQVEHGVYKHPLGMVEVWYGKDQANFFAIVDGSEHRQDVFFKLPPTPRQVANRARKFLLEITQK